MKKTSLQILILLPFIITITSTAQEKIFLDIGKTYKTIDKYYANEIVLKPDSTFIQRYYEFKDKIRYLNYQNLKTKVESNGIYSKIGKYYIFDEKSPNDFVYNYFKLTEKKLIYFYRYKGRFKRGGKFKLKQK